MDQFAHEIAYRVARTASGDPSAGFATRSPSPEKEETCHQGEQSMKSYLKSRAFYDNCRRSRQIPGEQMDLGGLSPSRRVGWQGKAKRGSLGTHANHGTD